MLSISQALNRIKGNTADSSPRTSLPPSAAISQLSFRQRRLTPLVTTHLFLRQVLEGNKPVAELRQIAKGSFAESSYCDARTRVCPWTSSTAWTTPSSDAAGGTGQTIATPSGWGAPRLLPRRLQFLHVRHRRIARRVRLPLRSGRGLWLPDRTCWSSSRPAPATWSAPWPRRATRTTWPTRPLPTRGCGGMWWAVTALLLLRPPGFAGQTRAFRAVPSASEDDHLLSSPACATDSENAEPAGRLAISARAV